METQFDKAIVDRIANAHLGTAREINRRVTARVNVVRYYQLEKLADKMLMSKSGCVEFILDEALDQAWKAAGFGVLSDAEINSIKQLAAADQTQSE
jgi:hypothetical protein